MDKIVFTRAYPLFGDYAPRNSLDQSMYVLLELPDGQWLAYLGCDFVGPSPLQEVWAEVLVELERVSPLLYRAAGQWPSEPIIFPDDAIDMLWQDSDGQIMCLCEYDGMYMIAGMEFPTREEAVGFAVAHLLPEEIFAVSEVLADEYPQVASALIDPWHD
ncbi:hypothetical protein [Alicyclobacillus ferrooxydans]|uniref:Uncharacterized protein n=1 Tax=Alicyclobacillus ferrooxydans TaxID=471514 RepID=A0A0P9F2A2_9BACL|nr:hypothetical protein [Alicyclobacillus ferrooxydans]KPV45494.1 hypothetical protein AN477_00590 [Alicyclobacillus ferrooxydans]